MQNLYLNLGKRIDKTAAASANALQTNLRSFYV